MGHAHLSEKELKMNTFGCYLVSALPGQDHQ